MQRRTAGKGVAHIAPPLPPSRMGSASSDKPLSRLNQKTLGVTNRIWLILVLFTALILFTRSILPSDHSPYQRHRLIHTDAKPRNYLNVTEGDPVPFSFCPALGPGDELASKYDPVALTKTRLHTGSGARVQRVIMRALAGHPVTISVIGGSSESFIVSAFVHSSVTHIGVHWIMTMHYGPWTEPSTGRHYRVPYHNLVVMLPAYRASNNYSSYRLLTVARFLHSHSFIILHIAIKH